MSDLAIRAFVDISDPDRMMERLEAGLSGMVLEKFLQGPVQDFFSEEAAWRFGAEGDKASGDWPELADATIALRTRMGFTPDETNIRTGEMFAFVTEHYDSFFGPDFAQIDLPGEPANPVTKAKIQTAQEGRAVNPFPNFGPTPPRPVIATRGEEDLQNVVYLLAQHVVQWMVSTR